MARPNANAAIAFLRAAIGVPYVWGGESRREGGFDCSGLVYAAFRAAGYKGIGRTTYQQIKQGVAVNPANLRPGDLVFPSREHVMVYIGNGKLISAPHTGANVHVSNLSDVGPILTARRILRPGDAGSLSGPGFQQASRRFAQHTFNAAQRTGVVPYLNPVNIAPIHLAMATPTQSLAKLSVPTSIPAPTLSMPSLDAGLPDLSSVAAAAPSVNMQAQSLDALRRKLIA